MLPSIAVVCCRWVPANGATLDLAADDYCCWSRLLMLLLLGSMEVADSESDLYPRTNGRVMACLERVALLLLVVRCCSASTTLAADSASKHCLLVRKLPIASAQKSQPWIPWIGTGVYCLVS